MIPIKLSLRNFMCYRDNVPPLNFGGIHIASICGNNGNGKSALVDAITWALWGQTRAKRDDDLIHTGQAETEVDFEFAVGEQVYRILRKHARPKRRSASGQTILEFQIAANGSFKSISGSGILQTQQKIIDTLHMDYSTFTNSAFLRQGHADEFTTSNPARRKQVLASILGLSYYDDLEAQAREMARKQETEKEQLESAISDITEELSQKPACEAELEQAHNQLARVENLLKEQEYGLNRLRQQKESLENKKAQLTQLEEHMAERTRTLEQWDSQIQQLHARINEYQDLITRRAAIEQNYTRLNETRKLNEDLNQKLRLVTRLNEEKYRLELAIVQASQELLREHTLAQTRVSELEATSQKLPGLRNELQQVQHQLRHLTREEETFRIKRQSYQELRANTQALESTGTRLQQEIEEIAEKLRLLLSQKEARCPLCETELGTEGLKLIEAKYTVDQMRKSDSLKSNQEGLADKKTELQSLENEISQLEAKLNQDRASVQSQASLLNQQISEAEDAINQLKEQRKALAEIEERLARKDFAAPQQASLKELEKELAALDYDPQQHEHVRQRLIELEQYEEPYRKLEEADRFIEHEQQEVARSEQAVAELHRSLESDNRKRQQLAEEITSLPRIIEDLTLAEIERQTLTVQQKEAQETIGNVKGRLEHLSQLEKRKEEKGQQLTRASKEEKIYRELAEAFGKKGIQALLIETALPEIEIEANRLLGRMTDNRMHVKIETQRETKKGDTIETLDINISDELGTRNYEMFSGGEAFRINFAIRIALSKLLARRAGAPLPTLIIDEGFGTQDTIGIEKLKEAINSIQDDFQKILVITHIEEFRDAFPARIDVVKTAAGSTLEVN
jgi:exonuclease SbcC